MTYIDLISGNYIDSSLVTNETEDGLVYYDDGCWKFLQKGMYKSVEDNDNANYSAATHVTLSMDEMVKADETQTATHKYYTEYFGLNDFVAQNKSFTTSAAISTAISVNINKPLKLIADIAEKPKTSYEFYIIDGDTETPIIPDSQKKIEHEKVFYNLPPRMDGTNYIYYRNFEQVSLNKPSMNDYFDTGVLYTVSYTPDSKYYKYTPKSNTVKIKTIIRIYDSTVSPEISGLTLIQGDI